MKLFLEKREENMEWFLGERINYNQFWAILEEFQSDCLTDWKKSSQITRI